MTAPYPTLPEVTACTEIYRTTIMNNTLIPDKLLKHRCNKYIELLICGGAHDIFTALAYPPAGFWIKKPEDVPGLRRYEGWLLFYNKPQHKYWIVIMTTASTYREFETKLKQVWAK